MATRNPFAFWLIVALALSTMLVIGCGGDDDDDSGDDDSDDDMDDDTDDDMDDDTGDDDTGDDDTGDDDTGDDDTSAIFEIDFEDYADGALGSPWVITQSGTSTVEVGDLGAKDGSGKVLKQDGGENAQLLSYVVAQRDFTDTTEDMTLSFDLTVEDNTVDGGIAVAQNYYGYALTEGRILVQDAVVKATDFFTFTDTTCGTLTAGTAATVKFDFDYDGGTYDVDIDGSDTACAGLAMAFADGTPLAFVMAIDFSDDGFGGTFQIDNMLAENSTPTTIFSDNFDSYSLGDLSSPWEVTASGGASTAQIVDTSAKAALNYALEIDGDGTTVAADYSLSTYQFTDTAADMWVHFDVNVMDSNAEFGFRTQQDYSGYGFTETQIVIADEAMTALDANLGYVDCGSFSAMTWHRVSVLNRFNDGTYDVQVDGVDTSCVNMAMLFGDGTPFGFIQVIDWSDEDYGGQVYFDNFLGELAE